MKHPFHAGHDLREQRGVADVAFDEVDLIAGLLPREVFGVSEREIVQNDHAGAATAKRLGDVGADESGAAGDECFHALK